MRIYLDNCIYQDLKKAEYQSLLSLVLNDKSKNIYCFSEAHLYDLRRDKSEEKYTDMGFIETIAEDNCFHYNEKINFEHITPKEYYGRYDWTEESTGLLTNNDDYSNVIQALFKSVPLNFQDLISIEQFPDNCPSEFKQLFTQTITLYDFALSFISFTEDMTNEQKKFKEFITYLHANSLIPNIYELLGIRGFDGEKVTDKSLFRETYTAYHLKNSAGKYRYNLFMDMYNGLEFFGLVKGKPRKQKMINLLNDARHAFFGAFCDIVVSKDEDFLNKTKFTYDYSDIKTRVLNVSEFQNFLSTTFSQQETLSELVSEIDKIKDDANVHNWEQDGAHYTLKYLTRTHWNYFDTITFVNDASKDYCFFSKEINNLSSGTLMKEFKLITDKLIVELGSDLNNMAAFSNKEISAEDEVWQGRTWIVSNFLIDLNFNKKMYLLLRPLLSDEKHNF